MQLLYVAWIALLILFVKWTVEAPFGVDVFIGMVGLTVLACFASFITMIRGD